MFESCAKSLFLQSIVSGMLSPLFLFKDKTSSQFDEFEIEIVNVLGKGYMCVAEVVVVVGQCTCNTPHKHCCANQRLLDVVPNLLSA